MTSKASTAQPRVAGTSKGWDKPTSTSAGEHADKTIATVEPCGIDGLILASTLTNHHEIAL